MPASYNSQPISGFTGHLPGAKWQVGSRYVPPIQQKTEKPLVNQSNDSQLLTSTSGHIHSGIHELPEHSNQPEKSRISFQDDFVLNKSANTNALVGDQYGLPNNILRPGSSQMSVGYTAQGIPIRYPTDMQLNSEYSQIYPPPGNDMNNHMKLISQPDTITQHPHISNNTKNLTTQIPSQSYQNQEEYMLAQKGKDHEAQHRSRSLPRRRIEKDPFEGIDGGWWSKGEVLRNKERREIANMGQRVTGGQYNITLPNSQVSKPQWIERIGEESDIPAAGYSGHIQGLRQLGIGKSFNAAAKEAKKEYVERRRARSGGREQFYDKTQSTTDFQRYNNGYSRPKF